MQAQNPDTIKHREIGFTEPHPDPRQADTAVLVLNGVEGIIEVCVHASNRNIICVSYDLNIISLNLIEAFLIEVGFHLDNSLLYKLKRALYYFTEENQRDSLAVTRDQDHNTRDIFMRNYRCKVHGCRDVRPEYWRKYL
ncbi:MAG: hypothetical protein RQ736_03090 [Thiogranum sp.]|nr:hypothetical protein [Thiogranum sp.]